MNNAIRSYALALITTHSYGIYFKKGAPLWRLLPLKTLSLEGVLYEAPRDLLVDFDREPPFIKRDFDEYVCYYSFIL